MNRLFTIFLLLFTAPLFAQQLHVDWTKFIGGAGNCTADIYYAIPTSDNGVLFTGSTNCNNSGNIPAHSIDANGSSVGNVLIGKLDSNQNISWIKVYGGTNEDHGMSAIQTNDGGYAVLAFTQSNDKDVVGNHSLGIGDLWLLRIDHKGNLLWSKCYGSPADDGPVSIAQTSDEGFILLGTSNGTGGDVPLHYGTQFTYDWIVIKIDSSGTKQWSKTLGGLGDEYSRGNILVGDNCYYLASSSYSMDHDCTDTLWHKGVGTGYDYYILKLDTAGNVLWDKSFGGTGGEVAYSPAIWDSRDSTILMNGVTGSNDYMVTGNHGFTDMWVVKIDKNGSLVWARCLGGSQEDEGSGIAINPKGGYIAYGNANPGTIGLEDGWLFALDSMGNIAANDVIGGPSYEFPSTVFSVSSGFLVFGGSTSPGFTEGNNIGRPAGAGTVDYATVSHISYWPLAVSAPHTNNGQLKLYPNPSEGTVRVLLPANDAKSTLRVIDNNGKEVYRQKIKYETDYIDINTAQWGKGFYTVIWQGGDGQTLTAKLIHIYTAL